MADIFRQPTFVRYDRRYFPQPDPVGNSLLSTLSIPLAKPFIQQALSSHQPTRIPYHQDFVRGGRTPDTIPHPAPFQSATDWPPPMRARQTPQDFNQSGYPATSQPIPIGDQMWPDIFRRSGDRDYHALETVVYLPAPVGAPFIPVDFPTPMRARATPQDFTFSSSGIPPAAPFNTKDWPLHIMRRAYHQDFTWSGTTTRGIPSGIAAPFNLNDWPVIARPKIAQADSYASPHVLLITPVVRPFAQTYWPDPIRARTVREGWEWGGFTTRGIKPVPPSSGPFDATYLVSSEVSKTQVFLAWSASPGAFGYRLYINKVAQPTILSSRTLLVSNLAIESQYIFGVVAVNAFGVDASDMSNEITWRHGSNEFYTVHKFPWN